MSSWKAIAAVGVLGTLAGYIAVAYGAKGRALRAPETYKPAARYSASLVIPAYNESQYIGRLLKSALNQSEPFTEIIVADSSPGPETREVAESYGVLCVDAPAGNISQSRNIGADFATGTVLVFSDADVSFAGDFLEQALDALEDGAVLAHPREAIYDSDMWNLLLLPGALWRPEERTTRCVAVWRDVFDAVGGYDIWCNPMEDKRCREDLDFGARVIALYGRARVRVLPILIATSARRYKQYGVSGLSHFDDPVRAMRDARL